MKRSNQGYLTSAYGNRRFMQQALTLALSIKLFDPDRNCCLITDSYLAEEAFSYKEKGYFQDIFVFDDNQLQGFKGKLVGYQVTPYERTLFVDSDCLLIQNIDHLWKKMGTFDFCIQGDVLESGFYSNFNVVDYMHSAKILFLPVFNGGCFSWNKMGERVLLRALEILESPKDYHIPSGTYGFDDDQPALGIAMAENGIRPLSNNLNLHFSFYGGSGLRLSVKDGYCGFKKGNYWCEPSVFHYNALAGIELYRSKSRKLLMKEVSNLRNHFAESPQEWPDPNIREILYLMKKGQWKLIDSR